MSGQDIAGQIQSLNKRFLELRKELQRHISSFDSWQNDFADWAIKVRQEEAKRNERWNEVILGLLRLTEDCDDFLAAAPGSLSEAGTESKQDAVLQIRNLHDGLKDILRNEGIVPLEVRTGEVFDPQRHEIVETVTSDAPHGTVVRVFRDGFMRKATEQSEDAHAIVVRKAKVAVSKSPETSHR